MLVFFFSLSLKSIIIIHCLNNYTKSHLSQNKITQFHILLCIHYFIQHYKYQIKIMPKELVGQQVKSFNILKTLGAGAWSTVFQAIDSHNNATVAVKVLSKSLIKQTPKLDELLRTEIKVLQSCNNENVINYIDSFKSEKYVFVVMEYCNGGDLEEYLDKKKNLSEDEATMFLKHIINGFKGLHQVGAMHRDFKAANVLLHNRVCKIADLGFAKQMQKKALTATVLGTSLTMAPQVLQQKPYGFQADIWSLGVVFYQMIYGKYPFNGRTDYQILKKIKTTRPDFSSVQISSEAKDFIEKCLSVNIKKRIRWQQIYSHPLITKEQNQFVYGLKSRLIIDENKDFYSKGLPEKNSYPDIKSKGLLDVPGVEIDEIDEQIRKSNNINQILNEVNERREKQIVFEEIEKEYLDRRNNIYFVFKFINPEIPKFDLVKANHSIALFVLSKRAYIDMKDLLKSVQRKENIFKFERYFSQFTNSQVYKNLTVQIKEDLEKIESQCLSYVSKITFCSDDIKDQFDMSKVVNRNFPGYSKQIAHNYWFLLAEYLSSFDGQIKEDLIKVLEALFYYKSSEKASVYEFDRIMTILDLPTAEKDIVRKYEAKYHDDKQ